MALEAKENLLLEEINKISEAIPNDTINKYDIDQDSVKTENFPIEINNRNTSFLFDNMQI